MSVGAKEILVVALMVAAVFYIGKRNPDVADRARDHYSSH